VKLESVSSTNIIKILQFLLDNNFPVNIQNGYGLTAIMVAMQKVINNGHRFTEDQLEIVCVT
jgi:hypothetical protein